jgi:multidrug efflux pump subunit AcrB
MNIAEFSIKKSVITWTMTVVMLVLGYYAYMGLPRLEDPEFAIKDAVIITPYPGASPEEVQLEVTEKIEKAVQEMGQLKRVESYSARGLSTVKVKIKDKYRKADLPGVWDEMRRRLMDYNRQLPPGAGPIMVNDDFGDVYGAYFGLVGDGFTYAEMKDVAELLKRELLVVQDVKKVTLFGVRPEAVYVEMSRTKMAALGITRAEIFQALKAKNVPVDSGRMRFGPQYLAINPTGEFKSEKDFGNLFIASKGGRLIYLKDVATVRRGYVEPPDKILRVNGQKAIGIAVSTVLGGNAVTMGDAVLKRIAELQSEIPVGMELKEISMQSKSVTEAVNGFVINLLESVAIVIVVLAIFMGLRAGILIGFILILTIAATFVIMGYYHITLERISLGALIIALGMLVDNAIVVVDGMKVKMQQGVDGLQAAKEVVGQNAMPLLGATAVAVMAFASIGGMTNSTGEYCRSLYLVILISLSLSWLTAVTTTPLITKHFILSKKDKANTAGGGKDAYGGKFYQLYRKLLTGAIKARWLTIGIVVAMFVAAIIGFTQVEQLFFPASTRPQFQVEAQFREGIDIRETEKKVKQIEKYLKKIDGVTMLASAIGGGHPRFILTYDTPVEAAAQYTNILVSVNDYRIIDKIRSKIQVDLEQLFPDACVNVKKFNLGPALGGKIQLRINGPDPEVLRAMADEAMDIFRKADAKAIRTEWGAKVKLPVPVLAEDRAMALGITRPMVAEALEANYSGKQVGIYREGIDLIPIIARAPAEERQTINDLKEIQIYSPTAQKNIPIMQVLNGVRTGWENARVSRWHRRQMIKIHADPRGSTLPADLMARIKPLIEQKLGVDLATYRGAPLEKGEEWTAKTIPLKYDDIIPLKGKPGYFISWGGELEDSSDAQAQLAANIPVYFGMMILIVIFMFNAFRQPLIIWLTVPLAVIGVTAGLLLLDQPFGFMALLGLMSLSGMLIKNAIVLIDQININIATGMPPFDAILDSGVSRMQPVMMAALTTMMGMIPLFKDAFFVSMAVTIVFGLGFATILTLLFVPVLYATFFKIR